MPPQQTNIISGTDCDAATLGLDLSIALTKEALSDQNAAGSTAASTRNVLGLLKRYWLAFQKRWQRQSLRDTLQDLSDRELSDIGLTRGEIDYLTPERAIDTMRDRMMHLWGGGGM